MVAITKPTLPKLSDLMPMLENIWHSGIVTNNGSYCQEFEQKLSEYLNTPYVSVVSNATNEGFKYIWGCSY